LIKLDPQFIRQIQDLMKQAEKQGLHVRDLLEQELLAEDPSGEGDELENPQAFARIQIEMNRHWKKMMKQLSDGKEIPQQPVPAGFHGEMRPYQQFGMSWMLFLRQAGFGACLADDMGLGKTIQLICYLLAVREQGEQGDGSAVSKGRSAKGQGDGSPVSKMRRSTSSSDAVDNGKVKAIRSNVAAETNGLEPALIVCPTSVLGNWQKELERFAPGLKVYLHYGANRLKGDEFAAQVAGADVVLSSYGLTHLDFAEFEDVTWSTIAIDEAQNIKNAATKQSRAVRKLRGRHQIALTGTPMENRLSELWSIFDFTNHGYLGSLGQFQKRFVVPIEKDGKKEKINGLQTLIRPFLLRRTKQDQEVALNLPDKQEQKEYCPLTAEQASLYEQLLRDTFAEIEQLSGFERKGLILGMLGKLKQLCNHPALYLKEAHPKQLLERSTKMEKLADLVENVLDAGESCLIFTQYIHMGEMIRGLLKKKFGVDVPFLNGSVAKQQRDVMIQKFQDREFPVFLLSLKAGGTGLNLTAANHVIHYDRWWNPAVENQATDRAYRIGQNRFVHVHKLISTGTLEEKIDAMLEKKQSLNEQIIQSESWITELAPDELEELLRLG
jgi:SNF2 family DNA or RNA helicase